MSTGGSCTVPPTNVALSSSVSERESGESSGDFPFGKTITKGKLPRAGLTAKQWNPAEALFRREDFERVAFVGPKLGLTRLDEPVHDLLVMKQLKSVAS